MQVYFYSILITQINLRRCRPWSSRRQRTSSRDGNDSKNHDILAFQFLQKLLASFFWIRSSIEDPIIWFRANRILIWDFNFEKPILLDLEKDCKVADYLLCEEKTGLTHHRKWGEIFWYIYTSTLESSSLMNSVYVSLQYGLFFNL